MMMSGQTPEPTPGPIVEIAIGYMKAKHLFAADEVGLFRALAQGPATLDELTQRLGIPRRTARISADGMVALGLVERDEDRYRNGRAAEAFLSGRTPADLRPFLQFTRLSYRWWGDFEAAIQAGRAPGYITQLKEGEQQLFSEGVEAFTAGTAHALAGAYEFERHRRLLDLGAGTGSFLIEILGRHPDLDCTLFELPGVAAIARKRLAARSVADRVDVIEGDFLRDPIPGEHDAFLLANVVHVLSPEQNQHLLRRIHERAPAGSRLLLVDFWTDPTHTEPVMAALMAGEFLLAGGEGDVYSEDEAHDWLDETGWSALDRRPLGGPASLIVAERS
jgi:SAM-dependent methyltransferase